MADMMWALPSLLIRPSWKAMGAPSPLREEEETRCLRGASEPLGFSSAPAPLPSCAHGLGQPLAAFKAPSCRRSHFPTDVQCSTSLLPPQSRVTNFMTCLSLPATTPGLLSHLTRVSQSGREGGTGWLPEAVAMHRDLGQGHLLSWKPAASKSQDTQMTILHAARIPQCYSGFYSGGMGHSTAMCAAQHLGFHWL